MYLDFENARMVAVAARKNSGGGRPKGGRSGTRTTRPQSEGVARKRERPPNPRRNDEDSADADATGRHPSEAESDESGTQAATAANAAIITGRVSR